LGVSGDCVTLTILGGLQAIAEWSIDETEKSSKEISNRVTRRRSKRLIFLSLFSVYAPHFIEPNLAEGRGDMYFCTPTEHYINGLLNILHINAIFH
jgi:hypothetical protein